MTPGRLVVNDAHQEVEAILSLGNTLKMGKIYPALQNRIIRIFYEYIEENKLLLESLTDLDLKKTVVDVLLLHIKNCYSNIDRFKTLESDFNQQYNRSQSESGQTDSVIAFSVQMGNSDSQIKGDRKAFRRWYGYDAVIERCHRQISLWEYDIHYCLNRWGSICRDILKSINKPEEQLAFFQSSNRMHGVMQSIDYKGDERVMAMAYEALYLAMKGASLEVRKAVVLNSVQNDLYKTVLNPDSDIWCQKWALYVLSLFDINTFIQTAFKRLMNQKLDDGLFVRKGIAEIYFKNFDSNSPNKMLRRQILSDASSHVRQGCAELLANSQDINNWKDLEDLCLKDKDFKVRAKAILMLSNFRLKTNDDNIINCYKLLFLADNLDPLVLKTTLHSLLKRLHLLHDSSPVEAENLAILILDWIKERKPDCLNNKDRLIFEYREQYFLFTNKQLLETKKRIEQAIAPITSGNTLKIDLKKLPLQDELSLGRILSVIAQNDFSIQLQVEKHHITIIKGDQFKRKFWRFWYEWQKPSPDKRQAYPHTIARTFKLRHICPSSKMSELSQTKVPGEPLFYSGIKSWKPELPLVDELISLIEDKWNTNSFFRYHLYGWTEIKRPKGFWKIAKALFLLTFRYTHYSDIRNLSLQQEVQYCDTEYCMALKKLGFELKGNSYSEGNE